MGLIEFLGVAAHGYQPISPEGRGESSKQIAFRLSWGGFWLGGRHQVGRLSSQKKTAQCRKMGEY